MTFIWFTYLFNSAHKMKDFKGIPMGQFIFVVLFWHFLFVCVDANYTQKAKQLDSKEGNIQRHLVDVSHFKRAGNVSPNKKAGSVSPTLDIAIHKGNVAMPIDLENHYRNKLWSLGKLLTGISNRNMYSYGGSIEDSNIVQSIDKIDVEGQRKVYDVDIKHIDDNDGDDIVLGSEEERDGDRYDYDDSNDNANDDNENDNDEYADSDNDHEDDTDSGVDGSGDVEYDDGNDNNNALDAARHNLPHRINPRGLGRIVTKGGRNKYKPVLPQKQSDTCECGIYNPKEVKKSHLRIVNGVETAKNQYPWMASIRYTGANHFCGGSIISDQFILTAAHCTFGMKPDEMQVTIGDHDLTSNDVSRVQTIDVKKIFNHPNYDAITTNNDLALLQLKKKIKFTWKTNPICLTPQDLTYYRETVTVMGWGKRNENHKSGSPVLKHVQVKVLPMQKCRNDFRYKKGDISPKMLCAYEQGRDACQGDSGGPLVWKEPRQDRYFQIGATSWGIGCASKFHPGVYTKLAKFLEWIYDTAKDSTFCQTYIPKGAKKRYKDGNKARLDKEQTKKMKDKKKEKEKDSSEEDGVHFIKFEDEEATTVGSIMISKNSNENINNDQEESTWMLANYTDNVISTTEKSHFANESIDYQGTNNNEQVKGRYPTTNFVHTSTETNIQSHNSRKGKSNDYDGTKDEEVKIDLNNHTHSDKHKASTNRRNKNVKGDISSKKRKNKKKGKQRKSNEKVKKIKNKKKGKQRKNKKKGKKRINKKKGKGRRKFSKKKGKGRRKFSKKKKKSVKKDKSTGKNKRKFNHSNKLKNVSNKEIKEYTNKKFRKQTRKRYRKKNDKENKQTKN